MAGSPKKTPTIFFWLSLLSSAAAIVMMFLNWFSFLALTFGNNNIQETYTFLQVDKFIITVSKYVPLKDAEWAATVALGAVIAVVALNAVHILWSLITIRRNTPRGILPGLAGLLVGGGSLIAYASFSAYIDRTQLDEYVTTIFTTSAMPYILIMLAVATVVFSLLNRQESRALYAVKHPRAFEFPPENPEVV